LNPDSDHQKDNRSQLQRWNPDKERFENWDGQINIENVDLQIGAVEIKDKDTDIRAVVDTDGNLHIEVHGDNPSGIDEVLRLSELGAVILDGVYDASNNTDPGNVGLVGMSRSASPADSQQNLRLTAATDGSGDTRALDVSLHDEGGEPYSSTNNSLDIAQGKGNLVDPGNSTTTPLGALGVFTGAGIDVSRYSLITVAVKTSNVTSGMLLMQFGPDNVNWDSSVPFVVDNGSFHIPHALLPAWQFFRVVYTNGSVAQAEFRMQTILHENANKGLTSRLNSPLDDNQDVDNVRAVIAGPDNHTGVYSNAQFADGHLDVVVPDQVLMVESFDDFTRINPDTWAIVEDGDGVLASVTGKAIFTGPSTNGVVSMDYKQDFRLTFGKENRISMDMQTPSVASTTAVRTWGLRDTEQENGAYFRLTAAGVMEVVTLNQGVETAVVISFIPLATRHFRYDIEYTSRSVEFVIEGDQVYEATDNSHDGLYARQIFAPFSQIETVSGSGGGSLHSSGITMFRENVEQLLIAGTDGDFIRPLSTDVDGVLKVSIQQAAVGAGEIEINEPDQQSVGKQGGTGNWFRTVPNGRTLRLSRFNAGSFIAKDVAATPKVRAELYFDPNGDGTGMMLIDFIYLDSSSDATHFEIFEIVGDGTAGFRVELVNWAAEPAEVGSRVVGIERIT